MKWKKYRTGDVLDFNSSNGIFHACNVSIEDEKTESNHPYIVRTSQNNGIRGYISEDESKLNPANTISFAQDTAQMFYQSEPYFTGNKVKVLSVKGHALTENIAIFLITCMNKAFGNFAWGSSYDTKLLQNVRLSLPVKTILIPDFESLEILAGGGTDMSNIDTSSWKEFRLDELFSAESGDFDIKKEHINGLGVDVVTAGETENGILGKSDIIAKVFDGNTITIDMFGKCTYRPDCYKMVTHARVFSLKCLFDDFDEKSGLYVTTILQKLVSGFSYSNMCSWNKIKNLSIKLPTKEFEIPDWEYMEKYIKATEKVVIRDVVEWKNEMIKKTKEVVGGTYVKK